MSISTVTSEALQLKLRQLLPSQQGFGTDLSASDTIIPIIDLTAAAEQSDVREDLQKAIAFGSMTVISADNTTVVAANTPGFYRIVGVAVTQIQGAADNSVTLQLSDGVSTKDVWVSNTRQSSNSAHTQLQVDLIFYLGTGESLSVIASGVYAEFDGSIRQIADNNGTLVNPVGFTPQ